MASNLALSMDADPLEDIHRRIKRLEAAVESDLGCAPVPNVDHFLGERIDQGSAEGLKLIHITSNYRQSANQCGGSNERIFKMVVRASVHELGPTTEDGRIRRKHAVALLYSVEPELDFFGLRRILFAGNFYPSLYFTDSHSGHVK
jgi:hypothetical protein